jgi:hypothetical protein
MFEDEFETNEFREFVEDMKMLPSIKTSAVYYDGSVDDYGFYKNASTQEDGTPIRPEKILVFGETKELTEKMLMLQCKQLMKDKKFVWVRQLPQVDKLYEEDDRHAPGHMEFVGRARIAVL